MVTGVDPELYELTRPTAPSTMSRVTDAFARLMSTADTTITRLYLIHSHIDPPLVISVGPNLTRTPLSSSSFIIIIIFFLVTAVIN